MLVTYIRNRRGEKVACLVAARLLDDIGIGWSKCNRLDRFNKEIARFIAEGRANKCLINKNPRCIDEKIINKDTVPTCVKKNIYDFVKRAKKYFKDVQWDSTK